MKLLSLLFVEKLPHLLGMSIFLGTITVVWNWITDNVITSTNFLGVILLLVAIDAAVGMWKHLKLKTFDWSDMLKGFLTKLMICLLGISTFNLMSNISDLEAYLYVQEYLDLVGRLMLMLYIGGSALKSFYVISDGKFPPKAFMKRFKNFEETLDPNDLKNN